jgi:AcrR family transcriptional regulator
MTAAARNPRASTELLRERIVSTAASMFAERGFAGTSVQAIAKDVGISKQALLYHFPQKVSLQAAVFQRAQHTWEEILPVILLAVTGGEPELDALLRWLITSADSTQASAKCVLRVLLGNDDDAMAQLSGPAEVWMAQAATLIRGGVLSGDFSKDVDPEAWLVETGIHLLTTLALIDVTSHGDLFGIDADSWRRRRLRQAIRMAQLSLRA